MRKNSKNKKQTVYITGGSSGIGLALAKHLSLQGADIVLFARGREGLEKAVEAVAKTSPHHNKILPVTMDISSNKSVQTALSEAANKVGMPDLVINSAGVGKGDYFENISTESFETLIRTNVFGSWYLAKAAIPLLEETGGHLVLMSSLAGLIGMYGYSAYGTSKFAVMGMAESLRNELRLRGITVSVVCPPEVTTPLVDEERKTIPPEALAVKKLAGILNADKAARSILRGIRKKRFLIMPGFLSKSVSFFHRISGGRTSRLFSDIITLRIAGKRTG